MSEGNTAPSKPERRSVNWLERREQALREQWIASFRTVIAEESREALAMLDADKLPRPRWVSE